MSSYWSDADKAQVAQLWAAGKSGGQIGDIMGRSRNGVIGQVHRLKLPKRAEFNRTRKPQPPRPKRYKPFAQPPALPPLERQPTTTIADDWNIPVEQRLSFLEVGPYDCRWPVGEPASGVFFFCGGPVEPDKPYCAAHCRRAFMAKSGVSSHRPFRD